MVKRATVNSAPCKNAVRVSLGGASFTSAVAKTLTTVVTKSQRLARHVRGGERGVARTESAPPGELPEGAPEGRGEALESGGELGIQGADVVGVRFDDGAPCAARLAQGLAGELRDAGGVELERSAEQAFRKDARRRNDAVEVP